MDNRFLLPAASLLEITGILTLLTNNGILIENVGLGFSIPAIVQSDIQGVGLLMAGGFTMIYFILNQKNSDF
jgi:hypothetical protein